MRHMGMAPTTLDNRWKRWRAMGVFARMSEGLASAGAGQKTIMIDATCLKAHRTASSLRAETGRPTTRAGARGRPLTFFMTAG